MGLAKVCDVCNEMIPFTKEPLVTFFSRKVSRYTIFQGHEFRFDICTTCLGVIHEETKRKQEDK